MRSISAWSISFLSNALLLGASVAFASADEGVNKGNGTLPVRMQGEISSDMTGETYSVESHICTMTARLRSEVFTTRCFLQGNPVVSYKVEGTVTIGSFYGPTTYPIIEICSDDEAGKIEVVVGQTNGKPIRFSGHTSKVLGDVVGIDGWMEPGGWSFYLSEKRDPSGENDD